MGTRLDRLYPTDEKQKRLNYKEIDKIVKKYKEATDEDDRSEHREALLKAFHKYFMKYVSLLKGTIGNIDNSDTTSFLALFLAGKNKTSYNYLNIYRYVIHVCKQVEDVDVYNELVLIFISLLDKFKFYPEVSFSRYITKYMRWSIKAWIMEMAKNPLNRTPLEYESYLEDNDVEVNSNSVNIELPNMDLAWVSNASGSLFSVLSTYERFLLYLNFKEQLGIRQISERLGRAKDTIHTHLQQAIQKLRDQSKKGEQ